MSNPIATITMADGRVMTAELYPEKAPNTVNNFISLANKGFYDGLIFHRVIPGFMIQGGCPNGNGMGGPGYEINGEFAANGFRQNDLVHTTGVLSMARTMAPNSAGSQFLKSKVGAVLQLQGDCESIMCRLGVECSQLFIAETIGVGRAEFQVHVDTQG